MKHFKNPKPLRSLLAITGLFLALFSCQKEKSEEHGDGSGNGNGNSVYGWAYKSDTSYSGCIDTAYYSMVNGFNSLSIQGSDPAGNDFLITLIAATGSLKPGTYTTAQGAIMMVEDKNGNNYMSTQPTAFTLKITTLNDTLVQATFSGTLTDVLTNGSYSITDGSLKALIGKPTPCGSTGNSGGTGGGSGDATYSLSTFGPTCSNTTVNGAYANGTALNSSNTVQLQVNVTKAGNWSVSTGAVNGISFSGTGTFSGTGADVIVLTGTGTPTAAGKTVIPVTAGSGSCSFNVTVN